MNTVSGSMRPFFILWFGQFISLIGTGMTQFALALWLWEQTGEVTPVLLTTVFFFLPALLISPFTGAMIDRMSRKHLMIACDSIAAATTLAMFLLVSHGELQAWHLYVSAFLGGMFQTIQGPALSASVTLLVPLDKYTRASGLMGLSNNLSQILSPVFAAMFYGVVGLVGILVIDLVTFLFAVTAMLCIHIPQPSDDESQEKASYWQDIVQGFCYTLSHKPVLYLILFFLVFNVVVEAWASLLMPLVLARTDNPSVLGWVQAAGGIGAVLAGVMLTFLPSPRHLMKSLLIILFVMGVLTLPISLNNAFVLWLFAHFVFFFAHSFIIAYGMAIEQQIVPTHLQGRVFSISRMVWGTTPIFMPLLFGFASDQVFEPAMREGGTLVPLMGGLVGSGAGAGIALIFVLSSLGMIGLAVLGMRSKTFAMTDIPARTDSLRTTETMPVVGNAA